MHSVIRDRLEQYLDGSARPEAKSEIETHLVGCAQCRESVARMREISGIVQELRAVETVEPAGGFYARVMSRIEAAPRLSVWNLLLDPIFGKRLVYASLAALVLMVGYVATTEPVDWMAGLHSPEVEMAQPEVASSIGADQARDRDAVLVDLVSHSE